MADSSVPRTMRSSVGRFSERLFASATENERGGLIWSAGGSGTSVSVAVLLRRSLGTVNVAALTPVEAPAVGAWKVNAGRPGMRDGTVSTTLAAEGTEAPVGAVKVTLTVVGCAATRSSGLPPPSRSIEGFSSVAADDCSEEGSISTAHAR